MALPGNCGFLWVYEWRRKFIAKIHADLVFQLCIAFLRCFRTLGTPIKQYRGASWIDALSCPLMASNYANLYLVPFSFWSRSGDEHACSQELLSPVVFIWMSLRKLKLSSPNSLRVVGKSSQPTWGQALVHNRLLAKGRKCGIFLFLLGCWKRILGLGCVFHVVCGPHNPRSWGSHAWLCSAWNYVAGFQVCLCVCVAWLAVSTVVCNPWLN